ncbi:hypothetical protein BBJ28_00015844 [Nothophytophthora sp. Chile5]|nr:hypothetical protein BBJ28_00015844 [Nothophytophthora sp. Chile5]
MPEQFQPNDGGDNEASKASSVAKTQAGVFEHLPDPLPVLRDVEVRQKLLQWNLSGSLQLQRFRVHRKLPSDADEALLAEFFQDESVLRVLSVQQGSGDASTLLFERLRVSATSMAFLEKLEAAGVVARDGSVRGCMDEDFDGCTAGDLLTEMLANPESANADVFSHDEDQREFLFQLLAALVIGGGALRQPDGRLQPYESITRALYRALLTVKKSSASSADGSRRVEITSRVYRVSGSALFPKPASRFHSCFAIVDARKRWLTVWYSPFSASW